QQLCASGDPSLRLNFGFARDDPHRTGNSHVEIQTDPLLNSGFTTSVSAEAAPRPLIRLVYQASPRRVLVNVVHLLGVLGCAPHVEVIKAALPKMLLLWDRGPRSS